MKIPQRFQIFSYLTPLRHPFLKPIQWKVAVMICFYTDAGAFEQCPSLFGSITHISSTMIHSDIRNIYLRDGIMLENYRWIISLCSHLQTIIVSAKRLYEIGRIVISRCPELKTIEIGEWCWNESFAGCLHKSFTVKHCPKLQSFYVGDSSLISFTRLSLMCIHYPN